MKLSVSPGKIAISIDKRWMRPSTFVFVGLAGVVLSFMVVGDRSQLLDQDNYINYFRLTDIGWFTNIWAGRSSFLGFATSVMTEELGWRAWVLAINALGVDPEDGVRITVVVLNVAMISALWNTRRPILDLCLWSVIPVGLATMGLFQIRQGMAFAIAMYVALRWKRPATGALIAGTIHTTFAFPALLLLVARQLRRRGAIVSVSASACVGLLLALASPLLFATFGGRRVDEYRNLERMFNATYVLALLIYSIAPAMIIHRWFLEKRQDVHELVIDQIAVMHVGLIVFLVTSFFVFPFAMSRIGYYAPAMIAILLPETKVKQPLGLLLLSAVVMMVMYDAIKNYFAGVYVFFL
ncbi:hypothetical protein WJ99_07885 [Burkholderia ubonensis]|uniref:hypothetical protein n=1 Tax=Burkholderia ubonensis TaxID=101571 RepID=UPI000758D364|nr:hypothetical protein [Burkholderia ubonensis]KVQ14863.1 hypothetical protein WJ99_07885 [Burkholderia ubonensis]